MFPPQAAPKPDSFRIVPRKVPNFPPRLALAIIFIACTACGGSGAADVTSVDDRTPVEVVPEDVLAVSPGALDTEPSVVGDQVGAPFDLGAVMRQVHFAYRPDGDAYTGGDSTYGVRVEAGRVELTAFHHLGGTPVGTETSAPDIELSAMGGPPERELPQDSERWEGTPLTLETASIRRGGQQLDRSARPLTATVGDTGELRLPRGAVTEVLRNSEEGVEQSWEFAERPSGEGDLIVRVSVGGQRLRATTAEGLHFAGDAHDLGFVYGHATFVDAEGARHEVRARYDAGAIAMRVPSSVIEGAAYPAVLDPVIGPEFASGDPILGPARYDQRNPCVSYNGTDYLVVWSDERGSNEEDIYGTRVSDGGNILDPSGIAIAVGTQTQSHPSVAHDGTNYLVVYRDGPSGMADIYGARVDDSGEVLDASGFMISDANAGNSLGFPSVNGSGPNFLVAWQDDRNGSDDIYATRVTSAGELLDTEGIAISTASSNQTFPVIDHNGAGYFVAWSDYRSGSEHDIYGTRVSDAGTVLDPAGIAISTATGHQYHPSIGHHAGDYVVVWADTRNDAYGDIYGTRISGVGAVLDSSGIAICTAGGGQSMPVVTYGGTNYLVSWTDNRAGNNNSDIYAARLSSAGAVLDTSGIAISTVASHQRIPDISYDGTNYLIVWMDYRNGSESDIYGARVNDEGSVLDPAGVSISTAAGDHRSPSVAHGGTNYLVVWQDNRSDAYGDIYGTRVSDTGTILDRSGIAISTAFRTQSVPSVAHDGSGYLVVWEDGRGSTPGVYGARVSDAGSVLEPSGIAISTGAGQHRAPSICEGESGYFVAWFDSRTSGYDIYGTRLSSTGTVLDPSGIAISTAAGNQSSPRIAYDGSDYLVVWGDYRNGTSPDIFGARLSGAGILLDPGGISISAAADYQHNPTISHDGTNYLVVWHDRRSRDIDIYGSRVNSAGSVLDASGIVISSNIGSELYPSVSHNGTNFLVIWNDHATDSSRIYGAELTSSGTLVAPARFLISGAARSADRAAITSGAGGQSLIAYLVDNQEVHARFIQHCVAVATDDATCDGIDDDCDGIADEDYVVAATSCGVGPCGAAGATSCVGGAVQDSCAPGSPAASDTTCDGIDDDCNGTDDEDFVVAATSCGIGACGAAGATSCVGGAVQDSCAPGSPAASDATCDGIDDDCNGTDDEDYVVAATSCGVGACGAAGATACVSGAVQDSCAPGSPAASDSTCDGIDDDCNGADDEDFVVAATSCGTGACGAAGATSCVGGAVQDSCTPGSPAASDATCDGIDDDCNGTDDEDFVVSATSCGTGACGTSGSTSCVSGAIEDSCVAGTSAADDATCDGVDDDCDGTDDEDYVVVATSCGVGACGAAGNTSCVSGAIEDSCVAGTSAADDATCDGVDDDCDGTDDEDYVDIDVSCGEGACAETGLIACVSGVAERMCTPGAPATDDSTCDEVDDDCDGTIDEDCVMEVDAGPGDVDAGSLDGGGSDDGGLDDGGGFSDGGPEIVEGGCGCRTLGSAENEGGLPFSLALGLIGLTLLRRRRRSRGQGRRLG